MTRIIPICIGPTAVSGVIGTDTAMGGGDYSLPNWTTEIMGYALGVTQDTPVAAETVLARANIVSNNMSIAPAEGLAAPIGSVIAAAVDGAYIGEIEKYELHLPVSGGAALTPNIRTLTTGTAVYGLMSLLITDGAPKQRQLHQQAGASTLAAVTNNNEANGTAFSLSGAANIVELIGTEAQITLGVAEGYIGRMRFQSSDFAGVNNVDLIMNPHGGCIAAGALFQDHISGVSRQKCNVPVQNLSQCNVMPSYRFLSSANLAVGVNFVPQVTYEV